MPAQTLPALTNAHHAWHHQFHGRYARRICRHYHGPDCPHYRLRWRLLDLLKPAGWTPPIND